MQTATSEVGGSDLHAEGLGRLKRLLISKLECELEIDADDDENAGDGWRTYDEGYQDGLWVAIGILEKHIDAAGSFVVRIDHCINGELEPYVTRVSAKNIIQAKHLAEQITKDLDGRLLDVVEDAGVKQEAAE